MKELKQSTRHNSRSTIMGFLIFAVSLFVFWVIPPAQAANQSSADQNQEPMGKPVKLGAAIDQTAYLAQFDRPVQAGIELAIEAVNRQGGVLGGRPLTIDFYNMEANPAVGVRVVQRLITEQDVAAILHGFSSASSRAVQPIVARREVPFITASVLPEDQAFEFTTIPPAKYMISARVEYLLNQGIKQVGVLYDGTPYNQIQLDILRKVAENKGLKIVGVEKHTNDAIDLRPQITALLQAGAEAVIKLSAGPTAIVAAKAMAQAGTDAPLVGGIDSLITHRQAAAAYEHYVTVGSGPQLYTALPADERSESLSRFMKMYKASGQSQLDANYMGRGWDAVWLLTKAINKAGSLKGPAIQKALEEMGPYKGASGTYDFSAEMHYGVHENPFRIIGFNSEGNVRIVYTPKDGS